MKPVNQKITNKNLRTYGIKDLSDLQYFSGFALLQVKGVGLTTVNACIDDLKNNGMVLGSRYNWNMFDRYKKPCDYREYLKQIKELR